MNETGEVVIAYLHAPLVHAAFCSSLLALCTGSATRVRAVMPHASGPNLSGGRNHLCRKFLDETSAPWLFMCDTDMWFPADTVTRLIAAADPDARPVVGGLCWTLTDTGNTPAETAAPARNMLRHPTMYEFVDGPGDERIIAYLEYPEDSLVKVGGTGAACLLIHRRALEQVEKTSGDIAAPWFRETDMGLPMRLNGEDLTFCQRCTAAGIPIHVHTGVRAGHLKVQMLL